MKLINIWNHFKTITKTSDAGRHCFQIGLYRQGLTHDLSKYSPEEFFTGVRYYQERAVPMRRKEKIWAIQRRLASPQGAVIHHYEYWIDISVRKEEGLVGNKMPLRYVAEMICDRIAACEVYKGKAYTSAAPLEYYEFTKKYITIHPETRALLERLLIMLKDRGEKETFRYLRELLKQGDY